MGLALNLMVEKSGKLVRSCICRTKPSKLPIIFHELRYAPAAETNATIYGKGSSQSGIDFEKLYMQSIKKYCNSATVQDCPLKTLKGKKKTIVVESIANTKEIKLESSVHSNHHNFQAVNWSMLSNGTSEKELLALDNEFKHLKPLEQDTVFYRGTHRTVGEDRITNREYDTIWNAEVGDIIQPHSFYAYTGTQDNLRFVSRGYAYTGDPNKCRAMLIEIRTPKGSRISVNKEHGGEGVFPRNAKYRLISKETKIVNNPIAYIEGESPTYPREHVVLEYIPN